MNKNQKGINGWSFAETSKGTSMEGIEWLGFEQVNRNRARIVVKAENENDYQLAVLIEKKNDEWICSVSLKQLQTFKGMYSSHLSLKTLTSNEKIVVSPQEIRDFVFSVTSQANIDIKPPKW